MDNITSQVPMADRMWFFEMIIGILVLVGIQFVFKRAIKYLRHKSIFISNDWKDKIDSIFSLPFTILLWILGISFVIEILGRRFGFSFFEIYINAFRSTGLVICISWIFLRWSKEGQRLFLQKDKRFQKVDPSFVHIIGKLSFILIVVIALMIILQVWGLNIAPLIAFGGVGAAVVGFAAKDVLANFFGGLMLHMNRPFVVGDQIYLPNKSLEGTIEDIGWNLTTIRDKAKRPFYLPNSVFSSELVSNFSRMTHRRLEERVEISGDDYSKIEALIENIKHTVKNHSSMDSHLPISVVLDALNQRNLTLYINGYILETRFEKYLQIRHELLMNIYAEVEKIGAQISIPSMKIYTESDSKLKC